MSDQDMSLDVEITGNSGGAQDAMLGFVSSIDRVPQSVNVSQASLDRLSTALDGIVMQHGLLADASDKTKTKVDDVTKSTTEGSKAAGEFNSVGGDMARMMSSLGVESGAAAGRIGAFAGALGSLKSAAPEIIAIVSAATAAIAGFEIGKEAIKSASDLEDSMTRLGSVVRAQGGSWVALSGQVKEFTDQQMRTTIFSDTQVVDSLNRLVASGMSVADSMTVTRVSEDLAAATGHNLMDVTVQLIEAQHGRLMGLESLGLLTRQQIKDGMTFNEVLEAVEQHMGGAAQSATTTFSGALAVLHNSWSGLLENAGTPFLALLTDIVRGVTPVVDILSGDLASSLKGFSSWASDHAPEIATAFGHIEDDAQNMVTYFQSDVAPEAGKLFDAFGNLADSINGADSAAGKHSGWDDLAKAISAVSDTITGVIGLFTSAADMVDGLSHRIQSLPAPARWAVGLTPVGALLDPGDQSQQSAAATTLPPGASDSPAALAAAFKQMQHAAPSAGPPHVQGGDQPLGGTKGSGSQPQYSPMGLIEPTQFTAVDAAAKAATAAVKGLSETEAGLTQRMNGASTMSDYLADKQKLYTASISGTEAVIEKLSSAHKVENNALATLTPEVEAAREKYNSLATAYNTADKALSQTTKPTKDQTKAVADAKSAADAAKKSYDDLNTQLTKTTSALQTTNTELDKQKAALAALNNEVTDLTREYGEWQKKQAAAQNESVATLGMSTRQLYDYYAQAYASDSALWLYYQEQKNVTMMTEIEPQLKQDQQKMNQEQLKLYQEDYQNKINFESSAVSRISSFMDAIVIQHKSMADELKTVYADIEGYFIDMVAKMLTEAMMAAPWIQALFGGGGVDPATSSTDVQLGAGGPGSFSASAISGGASSPLGAAISRAMSPSGGGGSVGSGSYAFGGGAGGGYGGGGSMSPDFSMSGGGLGPQSGSAPSSSGGASGGSYGASGYHYGLGGSPAMTGLAGVLARSGLGGMFGVGMAGDMIGGLAFGNKGYSAIGGAVGGILGGAGLGALLLGGFGAGGMGGMLAGLLAGGPAGWGILAAGALLGAFGGSMFGDHFNPADEPDQGSTQDAWGIANADMQGMTSANPMNASGKQYVMDSQTSAATSGKGWNLLMEQFVSKFRGSQNALPSDLQGVFPQIEQLWGGATDKQFFNSDGKDGYLDIGSGKRALWGEFWGVVQAHGQEISQLMQTFTPTDIYLSSLSGGMRSGGSSTPSPGGGGFNSPFALQSPAGGNDNSNAIASGGPGKLGGLVSQRLAQSISIVVHQHNSGTMVDNNNMARAIQDAVGQALPGALQDLNMR
jgi:hypothetical protein